MDSDLFNKITDETGIETLLDFYNTLQKNLQTVEHKLRNFSTQKWQVISRMLLSDVFIRELRDKVDWHYISNSFPLTENFIEEFYDRMDWESVSRYQNLSEDFMKQIEIIGLEMDLAIPKSFRRFYS